ncbi:fungal-specific transcription factor domain-containing protein [Aspergillus pseudodeflectus]|uniref:Fungal-specific transcription factor domain-containing protein n=1 Tax=Aspergillus pseudodeflectus TaxID=176178 RepID=A0ABR4JDE6_9EURO
MDPQASPRVPVPRRDVHLKVAQLASACAFCKARKIKCDSNAPCGACVKLNRTSSCSLAGAQSRDYVTHLRRKIQQLKTEIELRRHGSSDLGQHEPSDASIAESPEIHQPSAIDTLISDIGTLPIAGPSHYTSASNAVPSFATLLLAAASKKPIPPVPAQSPTVEEARNLLPAHPASRKLAEHYFNHIYPRLPFFSTQGFWAQFEYVYGPESNPSSPSASSQTPNLGDFVPDSNHGYNAFTVSIVLAISASSLSSSSSSVIFNKADSLFQTALRFRESINIPNTVAGVQSILFLIQFANLNPSSLDAWYLIGVGMRTCIDLGLHQDPQPTSSVSSSLLETRRRIWWSMYSFDRSMSLSCCRPMEVGDNVITAQLPTFRIGLAMENQEEVIAGFLQRYRILQIQSFIYDQLNEQPASTGEDICAVLHDMAEKLQDWAQNNPSSDPAGLTKHELLMGRMLLNRPCRLIPNRTSDGLEDLWRSAQGFAQIYRALAEANSLFYVRIASEKAYWTGLAMLFCYWKLNGDGNSGMILRPSELWTATRDVAYVLQALSERWNEGKVLFSKFEEACTRVIEATEAGRSGDNPWERRDERIPEEVRGFCNYSSFTTIWTADRGKRFSDMQSQNLRGLALSLESWQEA